MVSSSGSLKYGLNPHISRPTWTYKLDRQGDWKDHDLYPSFDLAYLNPVACNVLYALCLAVLWTATTLEFGYKRYTSNINLVYCRL